MVIRIKENMNSLLRILKKKLTKSKLNSQKVYARSIKRLYNVLERKDPAVPETLKWLSDAKVKAKYEKMPVNTRRHLSAAAHVYLKALGKESEYWKGKMFSDQDSYRTERKKNKKSTKEEHLWIEDGLKKLKQASTEFKRRISSKLKKEPTESSLWLFTQYLILRFYSEIQLRNDLATVELSSKDKNNYLKKVKGGRYDLIMRSFKSSDKIGERKIEISKALSKVLSEYIKFRNRVGLDHNRLLSNSTGDTLSKAALGKILRKLTKEFLNKGIGTRMLRIFNASRNAKILRKAEEISNNLLHTAAQSREYIRK